MLSDRGSQVKRAHGRPGLCLPFAACWRPANAEGALESAVCAIPNVRWEVDPAAWRTRACAITGGGLTPEQWAEIVPEQDYVSVCPSG
jgi:hypothetical protein